MLAGFCDWRVIVAAAGVTAVHHLSFNFILPAAIFPGGASLTRVMIHALIVVLETAVLACRDHAGTHDGTVACGVEARGSAASRMSNSPRSARPGSPEDQCRAPRRSIGLAADFEKRKSALHSPRSRSLHRQCAPRPMPSEAIAAETAPRVRTCFTTRNAPGRNIQNVAALGEELAASIAEIGPFGPRNPADIARRAEEARGATDWPGADTPPIPPQRQHRVRWSTGIRSTPSRRNLLALKCHQIRCLRGAGEPARALPLWHRRSRRCLAGRPRRRPRSITQSCGDAAATSDFGHIHSGYRPLTTRNEVTAPPASPPAVTAASRRATHEIALECAG